MHTGRLPVYTGFHCAVQTSAACSQERRWGGRGAGEGEAIGAEGGRDAAGTINHHNPWKWPREAGHGRTGPAPTPSAKQPPLPTSA